MYLKNDCYTNTEHIHTAAALHNLSREGERHSHRHQECHCHTVYRLLTHEARLFHCPTNTGLVLFNMAGLNSHAQVGLPSFIICLQTRACFEPTFEWTSLWMCPGILIPVPRNTSQKLRNNTQLLILFCKKAPGDSSKNPWIDPILLLSPLSR